jgi:glutamyl-tRNA synthetase
MVSTSSTNENDGSTNENDGSTNENDGSTAENDGSTNENDGSTAENDATTSGSADQRPDRVRMAPSPTGSPHVGLARTALFNWAYARHHGGTFVFRIEDTDAARNTQESYDSLLEVMDWLGLDWDEGPLKGGPFAPYRQSERSDIYADVLAKLRASKFTYDCYCTTDEVAARRLESGSKVMGYDGFCRELSDEQVARFQAEGRRPVVRFRMPEGSITFDDLVRGEITFQTEFVPDFALCRANGDPLYTLVAPVDDLLMEITHVLRGEDLLSSTPRQVALYDALVQIGVGNGSTPRVGHLPYVMGEGNKKLSKRDPQAHLLAYRDQGFLPEGLLNYLALLGWAIAADRDIFSLDEMVDAFDIKDVNPNPARFDLKKAEAINAAHMRLLTLEDLTTRVVPFLQHAGLVADPVTDEQRAVLAAAMPLVGERINKLTEAVDMLAFLLVDESDFAVDPTDAEKLLNDDGLAVVQAAYDALDGLDEWTTDAIQAALQAKLVDELGLKPRNAYGPVRVAVTGRRISPPLFESLELLGRERGLGRLTRALA